MEYVTDKKDVYCFDKLPANIRQIGEMSGGRRIYFEDFVVTYRDKALKGSLEEKLVFFIGKKGKEEAQDALFIYGAIEIAWHLSEGAKGLKELLTKQEKEWKSYFPEGKLCGWGCSVGLWNSQTKSKVQEIHEILFDEKDSIFYCVEQSEEQEEIYQYFQGHFYRMPGYMIYYGKNPWMQEYMLRGNKTHSFEEEYNDKVTHNIRKVIVEKEEKGELSKKLVLTTGLILGILCGIGVAMIYKNNAQMRSLQETMAEVSSQEKDEEKKMKKTEEQVTDGAGEEEAGRQVDKGSKTEQSTEVPEEETVTPAAGEGQNMVKDKTEEQKGTKGQEQTAEPGQKKNGTSSNAPAKSGKGTKGKSSGQKKTQKKPTEKTTTKKECWYLVKKGDTLSEIVWRQYRDKRYINIVKQVNHIADENSIKAGDRLRLPER